MLCALRCSFSVWLELHRMLDWGPAASAWMLAATARMSPVLLPRMGAAIGGRNRCTTFNDMPDGRFHASFVRGCFGCAYGRVMRALYRRTQGGRSDGSTAVALINLCGSAITTPLSKERVCIKHYTVTLNNVVHVTSEAKCKR
ncbi:hypothetical protein PYCCODRAFT_435962 [Trametes coccinea BRFM310]|uniref:Uncharacterized protein n=1 Tax=Trametes coccinea (strain BRFM310) TaxID=1353009 RepID=A0A1Y2ILM2_TRAC3|nr:hypothetical protein PYCCODRAFT_435962 [Trametes coccinea BRFM310]